MKKAKTVGPVSPPVKPERAKGTGQQPRVTRCLLCNGDGLVCDNCGEAEAACMCGDEADFDGPSFSDCPDCNGTGK